MSENIQNIDTESDEFIDAPKALRDHVNKLQTALKSRDERITTLTGQVTATALSGVLGEFKNPERVKRDLLSDKVDPLDSEAVSKWLESNAGDYARGDGTSTPSQSDAPDPDAEAHARLNAGEGLRQPADMSKIQAAMSEITPEMSGAEVVAVYKKHGL